MESIKKRQPELMNFLSSKAAHMHVPISGTFELTARCNLNCRMCYVRLSDEQVKRIGRERTEKEWLTLAEEARKAGMLFLLLTGGEPFMLPHFKSLYTELSKMGFIISINSNGTLIDEKCVEWLAKNPPSRMSVTLYGGNDETYRNLCRNSGMFDRVVNALRLLREADILVRATMTLTPYNVDDCKKVHEICQGIDVPLHMASYVFPPLRRDKDSAGIAQRLSAEEAGYYSVVAERVRFGDEGFLATARYRLNKSDEKQISDDDCQKEEKHPLFCRAGKSGFWIDWQGVMTPCGMMNYPAAKPFEEGFMTAWKKIVEGTEKLYMPSKCVSCSLRRACPICGAGVYCETGQFGVVPEYACRMAEATLKATQEAYDEIMSTQNK
ncbi:MAG: radical SAM protein [Clostridia bacterium]|nr:radical SAM protein [Clostridia bacterium]